MNRSFAQKIHEQDVNSYRIWLGETYPIKVEEGLEHVLFHNNPPSVLKEIQIRLLGSKLTKNILLASPPIRTEDGFEKLDDFVKIDNTVTLISNCNTPGILDSTIKSRPHFVKLIYQYASFFPVSLYEAYKEIMEEDLRLDNLSEVREFYESCTKFDLWTGHEFCAYLSHCDPEILDFISEHPETREFISDDTKSKNFRIDKLEMLLPKRFSRIFLRPDLYEKNLPLVKAALLGGAFELIHVDRDNWLQSSLKPKKGLEWAKEKGIDYHPVLNEYLLNLVREPVLSSGHSTLGYKTPQITPDTTLYTTPYLEMMQEVIRELAISRENQEKKEAIAALFEKKLNDHHLTPPSQKLADAMATLVRLPESQQGRAKRKG